MKGTATGRALSAHLKSLRTQRGLAVSEVAQRMDVDRSYVSQIENYGRDLRLETVRRYCDAIGAYIYIGLKEAS
ncbi:helix-turn-helix domain-containing protein [Amycolatopsis speibonae]|uniref:Helix-turn-helix domain-containing protein n=1 Tax=Amycolatopsis speibonae TaxID=1450224 RepID=A0ABV7P4L0_9PSEU